MSYCIFEFLFKVYEDASRLMNVAAQVKKRFTFNNFARLVWPVGVARKKAVHHDAISDFLLQNVNLV